MKYIKLSEIEVGERCILKEINITGSIKRRIQDLGFVKGSEIKCMIKSPLKEPTAYFIKGSVIALRDDIIKNIFVERV